MTRRKQGPDSDGATFPARGLEPHQLHAAAAPQIPLKQLATAGNFHDLDSLLEHLGDPPIFQLGHPLPSERFIPKPRAGSCPATHNDVLLREGGD
jgi:hypothetical protein